MVGLMTAWDKLRALWCWLLFAVCAAGLWLLARGLDVVTWGAWRGTD